MDDDTRELVATATWNEPFQSVPLPADAANFVRGNNMFRRVLHTDRHNVDGAQMQQVAMSIASGQSLGWEKHEHTTQLFLVVAGDGELIIGVEGNPLPQSPTTAKRVGVVAGSFWQIAPNTYHDVVATSPTLKLLTVYVPPLHPVGHCDEQRPTSKNATARRAAARGH